MPEQNRNVNRAQSKRGQSRRRLHIHCIYLSPFEPADSTSMTAHLADLVPNVSSLLQGWRTEKKRDLRAQEQEEREREPMEGQSGEKWGDMLAWRMTRGSELMEYRWDRTEWWRSRGAAAKWRYALGWLLVINMQRGLLNRAVAEQCKQTNQEAKWKNISLGIYIIYHI